MTKKLFNNFSFYAAIILLLMFISFFFSCGEQVVSETKTNNMSNIIYFKDGKTNLCFAGITFASYGGYEITSITCVPCDSLYRIQYEVINKK